MFTHMRSEKMDVHSAHGNKYKLQVYLVEETSEYRIYISKENDGVGDVFSAKYEVVKDAKNTNSFNNIDDLIEVAKTTLIEMSLAYTDFVFSPKCRCNLLLQRIMLLIANNLLFNILI
jgi:hypothetical protein